ncbi:uncharacterized protein LOC111105432 isoform X1 [Crassostrea virginica]|uniref:Uncharacterized protein LOC111105432 isoform X2 n=1 Tax=Crassostrea virginica TaxID=6565 RepID=A0A8B8AW73_CRAVI|nr:uncharacterized protein LOC111105432 isoform X2 [Crassostrea virginica]
MFLSILGFSSVILQCVSNENRCDGPLKCCQGYKWNVNQSNCIECPYPHFGRGCHETCNCTQNECNILTGCESPLPTTTTVSSFPTTNLDTMEQSKFTVNTTRDLSLHSTVKSFSSTSGDNVVSVSSTEMDAHSKRKALNALLLTLIYSLSPITGVLLVLYVSLRGYDFTQKRRALRLAATEHTTGNHYEEVELTTIMTNSGFP